MDRDAGAEDLRGGRRVAGTGLPGYRADLGVRDGRIERIGRIEEEAERTIDASGLIVTPGFIDVHNHGAFGHSASDGAEATLGVARSLPETGTTAWLPTIRSAESARGVAHRALIVLLKSPEVGKVKTRFAASSGAATMSIRAIALSRDCACFALSAL